MKISDKIRLLLARNGMTQTKLSKELNISQAAIAKWINGTSRPSPDNLLQMAKIFAITIDEMSNDNLSLPNETSKNSQIATDETLKIRDDFEKLMALKNEISESLSEFAAIFDKRLSNIEKILKNKKP
ncbi:MAG: helix-turn-helix transcriptional regulator [Opitutales bacterium]|nr:helix-turn-helix transcriptional regulator [Opitutales bacterium]